MGVAKIILMIVIVLFLILFINFICLASALNVLLYPEIYQKSFEKNGFYEVIENITSPLNSGEIVLIENNSREITDEILGNVLKYFRGESKELELKIKINNDGIRNYLLGQIQNLPACDINQNYLDDSGKIVCRDISLNESDFLDKFILEKNIDILQKNEIDLKQTIDQGNNFEKIGKMFSIVRKIFYFSIIISLGLLGAIVFLNLLSVRKSLRWIGITFFASGIVGMIMKKVYLFIYEKLFMSQDSIMSKVMGDLFSEVINKLDIYLYSLVVIGIVFFVVSWVLFVLKKVRK